MRSLLFSGFAIAACSFSARAATVSSSTNPDAILRTFDTPAEAAPYLPGASSTLKPDFTAYAVPGGSPSGTQVSLVKGASGNALQMRNGYAGSFSVDFHLAPFDAQKLGDIYFDYKLNSDVKVNIFFRLNGVYHCAIFSGPPRVRPGGVLLGQIRDVKAEGLQAGWRRAHIPLRDWLRDLYPTADTFPIDEVICGNWDNTDYLMAGFGGNGAGATWQLDNFALLGTSEKTPKIEVAGASAGATWALDNGRNAPEIGKATPLGTAISLPARDGFAWLWLRDKAGAPLGAWAVLQAASAPKIGDANLENNELSIEISAPRGLDMSAISLSVGDRKFDRAAPELRWRGDENRLVLDAARAGLTFANGSKASVKIEGVKDFAGRAAAAKSAEFAVDWARAAKTIHLPRLAIPGIEELQDGTFENSSGGWLPSESGGALVEREEDAGFTGQTALRVTAAGNATPFRAWVRRTPFDAAKYPVIAFWYRAPANMRADFLLGAKATTYSVQFTDKDNPSRRLGTIAGVVADNAWHFASFNVAEMLRAARPGETDMTIDWLAVGDTGWLGNARGTRYLIDDFRFVPAVAKTFQATLQLDDVTGIKAVAWSTNDQPQSEVPATPATGGNKIEVAGTGLKFIHARVQNGAGKWSQTVHIPVYLQ